MLDIFFSEKYDLARYWMKSDVAIATLNINSRMVITEEIGGRSHACSEIITNIEQSSQK